MVKGGERQMCASERAISKILHDFNSYALSHPKLRKWGTHDLYDAFVREKWDNARTRLTVFKHLVKYSPTPGALDDALDKLRCHFVTKALADEAAAAPPPLKTLHDQEELWKYSRKILDFTYGKYKSDRTYSAMWALAIITGNCIGHVAKCVSLRLKYESDDHTEPPAAVVVRWGRRNNITTSNTVEYSTDGMPTKVWAYIKEVWQKEDHPFSDMKGDSIASCANRWLKEKRKFRIEQGLLKSDAPSLTSTSARIYGVHRDVDLVKRGVMTAAQYKARSGHAAATALASWAEPTPVSKESRAHRNPSVKCGKKSGK